MCCQLDSRCIQKVCCPPSKQTKFQLLLTRSTVFSIRSGCGLNCMFLFFDTLACSRRPLFRSPTTVDRFQNHLLSISPQKCMFAMLCLAARFLPKSHLLIFFCPSRASVRISSYRISYCLPNPQTLSEFRYRIITKVPSWTCPGPSCADSKPCQGGRTLYRWTHSEVWIPAGKGRQSL